jgi:hypothetical protein
MCSVPARRRECTRPETVILHSTARKFIPGVYTQ